MSNEDHSDIYEKLGNILANISGLKDHNQQIRDDLNAIKKDIKDMTETMHRHAKSQSILKTKIAAISTGIATGATLLATWIWEHLIIKSIT